MNIRPLDNTKQLSTPIRKGVNVSFKSPYPIVLVGGVNPVPPVGGLKINLLT